MEIDKNETISHNKIKVRKTHVNFPAGQKADVVRALEEPGATFSSVALRFQIDRRTVARLHKKKADVLKTAFVCAKRKRLKCDSLPEMEAALLIWLKVQYSEGARLSGCAIRSKARSLAAELGVQNFAASTGWFSRFRARNEIAFQGTNFENKASTTDDDDDDEAFQQEMFTKILGKYHSFDMFCARETTFLIRASLNQKSLNDQHIHSEDIPEERMTVLLSANMDGSERRPLLLIGQSHSTILSLPVEDLNTSMSFIYKSDEDGRITDTIWLEWLQTWDYECRLADRHICLFVSDWRLPVNIEPTNIHFVFLPPNSKWFQHPMDLGVINDLKFFFHTAIQNEVTDAKYIYRCISSNSLTSQSEYVEPISLSEAIPLISEAWQSVSSQTVANCFTKGGFTDFFSDLMNNEKNISVEDGSLHLFNVKEEPLPAWENSVNSDLSRSVGSIDSTAVAGGEQINDNSEDEYSLTASGALYHLSIVKRFVQSAELTNCYEKLASLENAIVEAALASISNKS